MFNFESLDSAVVAAASDSISQACGEEFCSQVNNISSSPLGASNSLPAQGGRGADMGRG